MTTQVNWMRRGALGVLALGATIPVGVTAAAPAGAAPATGTATASAGSTRTLTRNVDVDGDGRRDTVRITWSTAREGATVSVRTATKVTSTLHVGTWLREQGADPWVGSAHLDGERGADLILLTDVNDMAHYEPYTWRKGHLTQLRAPDARAAYEGWGISSGAEGIGWNGYSVGTSGATRTVTHWDLPTKTRSGRWYGTATTYRWSTRGWIKDATTKQSLTQGAARQAVDWGGLTIVR